MTYKLDESLGCAVMPRSIMAVCSEQIHAYKGFILYFLRVRKSLSDTDAYGGFTYPRGWMVFVANASYNTAPRLLMHCDHLTAGLALPAAQEYLDELMESKMHLIKE